MVEVDQQSSSTTSLSPSPQSSIIDWTCGGFGDRSKLIEFDDGHCPVNFRHHQQQCDENNSNPNPPRLLLYDQYVNYNTNNHNHNNDNGQDAAAAAADDDALHHRTPPTSSTTSRKAQAHVIDDAVVSENIVDRLYDLTVKVGKPWGTYVTREQIILNHCGNAMKNHDDAGGRREKQQEEEGPAAAAAGSGGGEQQQQQTLLDEIAIDVAASFIQNACSMIDTASASSPGNNNNNKKVTKTYTTTATRALDASANATTTANSSCCPTPPLWAHDTNYHGVAVWALPSSEGTSVPYHIDYAEQVRYETNVIVPPILAGTLHCTRMISQTELEYESKSDKSESNDEKNGLSSIIMKGGDFGLYLDDNGFEHYHEHGYKCRRKPLVSDGDDDKNTVIIPYKYNRMIIQSGHLPHWSTKIEALPRDKQRVICGFNVFGRDVGPFVQQYPEHSEAFRKRVIMLNNAQQKQRQQQQQNCNTNNKNKSFNLESIRSNPRLSQMLVMAKREKVKRELVEGQNRLDKDIKAILHEATTTTTTTTATGRTSGGGVTVKELMQKLGREKEWPRPVDVQVHIHHGWKQGKWNVYETRNHQHNENQNQNDNAAATMTSSDLVSPSWIVTKTM